MKRGSGCCAVDIFLHSSLSLALDSVGYITFLFSGWRIDSFPSSGVSVIVFVLWARALADGLHAQSVMRMRTLLVSIQIQL